MMRAASSSSLDDDKSNENKEEENEEAHGESEERESSGVKTRRTRARKDDSKRARAPSTTTEKGSAVASASRAKAEARGAQQETEEASGKAGKLEVKASKAEADSAEETTADSKAVETEGSVVIATDVRSETTDAETAESKDGTAKGRLAKTAKSTKSKAKERTAAKAETDAKAQTSEAQAQTPEAKADNGETKSMTKTKGEKAEAAGERDSSASASGGATEASAVVESASVKAEAVDGDAEVDAVAAEEGVDDSAGTTKSSSASASAVAAAAAAKENKAEKERSDEGKKGTSEAVGKIMLPPGGSFPRGSFLLDGVVLKRRRGRPSREPKADDFVALAVLTEEEQRKLLEPQKQAAAAAGEPVVLTPPPQGTTTTTTLSYAKPGEGETEDENIKIMGYHRFRGKQKPTQIWGVYGELMRKKQGAPRKVPLVTDFIPLDDTERQEALAAGFPMPDKPTQPPPPPPPPKQTTSQPSNGADPDDIMQVSEFRFPGRQHATKIFRVNGELRKRKAGKPRLVAQASDFVPLTIDELHQVEGKPWNRGRPKRPLEEEDKQGDNSRDDKEIKKEDDKETTKEGDKATTKEGDKETMKEDNKETKKEDDDSDKKETLKKPKLEQDATDGDSSAEQKVGSPQESKSLASGDVELLGSVKFKGRQYSTPLFRVAGQIRKRKPGKPRLVPQVRDFLVLDGDEMEQVEASGILLREGQPLPEVSRKRKEAESAAVGGLALDRVAEAARKLAEDEKRKKEKKRLSSSPSVALAAAATTALAKEGGREKEDYDEDAPVVPWIQHRFRGKPYPTQLFRVQGQLMKRKPGKPRLVPQVGDFVPLDKDELHQVMQRGDVPAVALTQEGTSPSVENDEGAKRLRLDRSRGAATKASTTAESENGDGNGDELMESPNQNSSAVETEDDKAAGDKAATASASQGEAVMAG